MFEILFLVAAAAGLGGLMVGSFGGEDDPEDSMEAPQDQEEISLSDTEEGNIIDYLLPSADTADKVGDAPEAGAPSPADAEEEIQAGQNTEASATGQDPTASNDRVLLGSGQGDNLQGGDADQTMYHTNTAFEAQLSAPHHPHIYTDNKDGASDTLHGGDGDDTLFFGTGDHLESGSGSDMLYGFLDLSDDDAETIVADFEIAKDKLIIFLPDTADLLGLDENASGNGGVSFTVQTSVGNFTLNFPNLNEDINIEAIEKYYDPEQHPLIFISQHASINSDIFIIQNAGYQ
jgi:Ca2+-binding RTX toxin-like protein